MNILLDKLDFNESWAYETLKNIIKPEHRICIIPFAFHDDWIRNNDEWKKCYDKLNGEYYKPAVSPFYTYGISDENITLINYFNDTHDSSKLKINSSDIIFFTGGYPEKIMRRLGEFDLVKCIENHKGIKIGWSAGAMIQCFDYYISPDEQDYPEFLYEKGLNCIKDFAVEVHYKNTESQNSSIEKYMKETGKTVYTTEPGSAIIVDGNTITLLGNAKLYNL